MHWMEKLSNVPVLSTADTSSASSVSKKLFRDGRAEEDGDEVGLGDGMSHSSSSSTCSTVGWRRLG